MLDNFIRIAPISQCSPTTEGLFVRKMKNSVVLFFKSMQIWIHVIVTGSHLSGYAAENLNGINIFTDVRLHKMFVLAIPIVFLPV